MARAIQWPRATGKLDAGTGPETGRGERARGVPWRSEMSRVEQATASPRNGLVGLRNWLPLSGEPWANHEKAGHGKAGKRPELWDGFEVSAVVRVDPEARGSIASVKVGSHVSKTQGNVETVVPGLQLRTDNNQVHPRARWVPQPVTDGE